jgi:predicted PurR-regulated permease PerM
MQDKLYRALAVMGIVVLTVVILVYGKPFLVPLTFAAILAMLFLPITKWLESKKVNRSIATLSPILLLLAVFAGIIFFASMQVSHIGGNTSKIGEQVTAKMNEAKQFVAKQLNIPVEKQDQMMKQQQASSSGKTGNMITGFLAGVGGFLTNFLLILVYIFLLIYFRQRLKGFIVRLVPKAEEKNAIATIDSAQKVARKYLLGMFMMIVCLWIMYGIGFAIVGVKNAAFFAVLCGTLELVPFVGNLLGTAITLIVAMTDGGGTNVMLGILITYAVVQFLQSYILEPLVVGAEVSINPLFTIVGIVAGEQLWGIPGMILAIPIMGITKIVFDHVNALKPYAYLIGEDKKESGGFRKKINSIAK